MNDDNFAENSDDIPPARRKNSRLRNIALGMVIGLVLALVGFGIAVVVMRGDTLPAVTAENLAAAKQLWKERGPANYDMEIEQTGVNPAVVHLEVRNGEVTAMTHNGHDPGKLVWDYWSVPALLNIIQRDLDVCLAPKPAGEPQPVIPRGKFDEHDGHPQAYHRVTPNGADAIWHITKFQAK